MSDILPPQLEQGYPFAFLPDGSQVWSCHAVSELDGTYYRNPEASPEITEAIFEQVASSSPEGAKRGSFAHVHRVGNLAIKTFRETAWQSVANETTGELDARSGLSAIMANVAVHEGLRRIRQPLIATRNKPKITAPKILGAFVGYEPWNDVPGRASPIVWAMSFEKGHHPDRQEVALSYTEQSNILSEAIGACGMEPFAVYHDLKPNNLIVQKKGRRLVKIDSSANYQLWK